MNDKHLSATLLQARILLCEAIGRLLCGDTRGRRGDALAKLNLAQARIKEAEVLLGEAKLRVNAQGQVMEMLLEPISDVFE